LWTGWLAQACVGVDHVDVLAQMAPIDRETAFLLMRNVAGNLAEPATLIWQLQGALGARDNDSLPLHSAPPCMQATPDDQQRVMPHPALQAPYH
jgi:hypothetical protein